MFGLGLTAYKAPHTLPQALSTRWALALHLIDSVLTLHKRGEKREIIKKGLNRY